MTSQLKSETARINGAKSKGPKSPETRAKSAANSLRHGLTAVSTITLDCESPDEFKKLLADFVAMHRQAATHVAKILKGAKVGDIPIEQPNRFEFTVSLRTAKAIGIELPTSILLRADEVIE